jgi:hypothetical protein
MERTNKKRLDIVNDIRKLLGEVRKFGIFIINSEKLTECGKMNFFTVFSLLLYAISTILVLHSEPAQLWFGVLIVCISSPMISAYVFSKKNK